MAPGKLVRISKMERVGQGPVRWSIVGWGWFWSVGGGVVSIGKVEWWNWRRSLE